MRTTPHFSWTTLEYNHRPKTNDWYWAVGVTSIAATIASLLIGNGLFGFFLIVAGMTVMILASKAPKEITCDVSPRGINISKKFFAWSSLDSFWIHENFTPPRLVLVPKGKIVFHTIVPIGESHCDEIRKAIAHHLKEHEHQYSISEAIAEYLGFL